MSDSSNPHLASIAASLATMASIKKSRARSDFLTPLVLVAPANGAEPPPLIPAAGEALAIPRADLAPLSSEQKRAVFAQWRRETELPLTLARESACLAAAEWLATRSPAAWQHLQADVDEYQRLHRVSALLDPEG